MSTPPFVDAPEGVELMVPPQAPSPLLLARPAGVPIGTALLVPGFTGSKEDFIAILAPLAARGWTVAAMDLPGQNGAPALGPRGHNDLDGLAGAVARVISWLDAPPVHLLGHSAGGLVTREVVLAGQVPLASWTALCSGPGPIPSAQWPPLVELLGVLAEVPMATIWELMSQRQPAPAPALGPGVAQFLQRRFLANDPHALADLASTLLTVPDRSEHLAEVLAGREAPRACVVTGSQDDVWPPDEQREMARRLAAEFHQMAGVGHSPAAAAPQETARILDDFWSSVTRPPGRPDNVRDLRPHLRDTRPHGARTAGDSASGTGVMPGAPGYTGHMALHATLECDRLAPRTARRAVCEFLEANDLGQLSDDAALLTSELVTNAVRHACGPIHLDAYLRTRGVRLEVADESATGPAPRRAAVNDEGGRGMELVEKLADTWGWRRAGDRKVVWLELAI